METRRLRSRNLACTDNSAEQSDSKEDDDNTDENIHQDTVDKMLSEKFDKNDIVQPVFRGGKYFNSVLSMKIFFMFLVAVFVCEIIGDSMKIEVMMPSYLIIKFGDFMSTYVTSRVGYFIGCISDLGNLIINILRFVRDTLWFHFKNFFDTLIFKPIYRIFGATLSATFSNLYTFWDNFTYALNGAYNMFLSYIFGIMVTLVAILVILLSVETCGRRNKMNFIRPSSVLVTFANTFYKITESASFLFGYVTMVITALKKYVKMIVTTLFPFLEPYLGQMKNSFKYISLAVLEVFNGPIVGFYNGMMKTLKMEQNKEIFLLSILITLLGYLYFFHYKLIACFVKFITFN